ncbi:hypothetical protein OHA79_09410 [Streptomyces sp. NBC_00841]|uniref:hypothetical protein n=1 Tax=Streptomyces sp. NBC_00841 TaxID=2975847 RepID=UPI002DD85951|nr:hypothetical protein [Streptomyces sp. NBC_00841]WRZ98032.1 hypothetical protein OHA79_09410 [Streptomyces sp. NBC_00841]
MRFTLETYDHSGGQEEEWTFTDVDEALDEFKLLLSLMSGSFSVVLRRETD